MMRHDITSLRDKKTIGRVAEIISFVNKIIRKVSGIVSFANKIIRKVSEIVSFVNEIIRKVSEIIFFVNEIIRKGARLEKRKTMNEKRLEDGNMNSRGLLSLRYKNACTKKASAKTRTGGEGCRSASFRRQFVLLSC